MNVDTNLPWHVQKIPFVPIRLARPRVLHGLKHVFLDRSGTNDHEQPRSVRLIPMLFGGGVKTRPEYQLFNQSNSQLTSFILLQNTCIQLRFRSRPSVRLGL